MPTYRTAGPWGPGAADDLDADVIDNNFYDHENRIAFLETNPPTADSVVSVSQSGFDLTFHTTLGNALGPLTMPVVQFRWRGEWSPLTLYEAADTFIVTGTGLFTVMADHTSAATFDPDATGGSPAEALYNQLFGVGTNTTLDDLSDVSAGSPVAGQVLRYIGGSPDALWQPDTLVLDDLGDVSAAAPSDGDVLTYQAGSPTGWIASAPAAVPSTLDSLTDVSVPSPADGDFLRYEAGSPAGWINEAGTAISSLPAATLPLNTASLIEISEASGSPITYESKRLTIAELLDAGDITLGSTAVALGSTVTTIAGLTLSNAAAIGIGIAPAVQLHLGGAFITTSASLFSFETNFQSSNTVLQPALYIVPTFNPSGASLTAGYGIFSDPLIAGGINIGSFFSVVGRVKATGYANTVASAAAFAALAPILGTNPYTAYADFRTEAITNGNGATSGTITNRHFLSNTITAGSSGATINNYGIQAFVPSGGASAGTVTNRALYITGNGGTPSGSPPGTVNNHAIYSDSTAMSLLTGGLTIGTTTLLTSSVALGNGAAAAAGTLANAPAAGNPTKWIPINDNGTVRHIPAW